VLFSRVTGWFRGTNPASSLADQTPWMMVGIDEAVRKWQEVRCVIDCRLSICHGVKVKTMPFWVLKVLYTSIYIYWLYYIHMGVCKNPTSIRLVFHDPPWAIFSFHSKKRW
jgi:hypothetical protein